MSARTTRIERLIALREHLDAPFNSALSAGDIDGIDRTLDRKRAVSAAITRTVAQMPI